MGRMLKPHLNHDPPEWAQPLLLHCLLSDHGGMKKPHAEPSAWPGTGLGKALFLSPAPVYTKPLNLPAKRDCVSLRLSVFNGKKSKIPGGISQSWSHLPASPFSPPFQPTKGRLGGQPCSPEREAVGSGGAGHRSPSRWALFFVREC